MGKPSPCASAEGGLPGLAVSAVSLTWGRPIGEDVMLPRGAADRAWARLCPARTAQPLSSVGTEGPLGCVLGPEGPWEVSTNLLLCLLVWGRGPWPEALAIGCAGPVPACGCCLGTVAGEGGSSPGSAGMHSVGPVGAGAGARARGVDGVGTESRVRLCPAKGGRRTHRPGCPGSAFVSISEGRELKMRPGLGAEVRSWPGPGSFSPPAPGAPARVLPESCSVTKRAGRSVAWKPCGHDLRATLPGRSR